MKHEFELVRQEHIYGYFSITEHRVRVTNKLLNEIENEQLESLKDIKECLIKILAHTTKSDREFLVKEIESGHIDGVTFLNKKNNCGCIYGTIFKKNKINLEEARIPNIDLSFGQSNWDRDTINTLIEEKLGFQIPAHINEVEDFIMETYPGLTNKNYIPLALIHKWILEYETTR